MEPFADDDLSQWGPWEHDKLGYDYRSRLLSNGEWDYQYRDPGAAIPRSQKGNLLETGFGERAHEEDDGYEESINYKTSPSHGISRLSIQGDPEQHSARAHRTMVDDSGIPTTEGRYAVVEEEARGYGYGDDNVVETDGNSRSGRGISPPNFESDSYAMPLGKEGLPASSASSPAARPTTLKSLGPAMGGSPTDLRSATASQLPSVTADNSRRTSGQKTNTLHPDFKVCPAKYFEFGKVFKTLWMEPMGQGNSTGTGTQGTEQFAIPLNFGETGYGSIRRFVVAAAKQGHCLCVPILTYGGQATMKSGVKPQDHAIIYTVALDKKSKKDQPPKKPSEQDGEEKLRKRPIRMEPRSPRDVLDACSRLNYAKIYTVEYNTKVSFIGKIHPDSVKYFNRDYNDSHAPLPQNPDTEYSEEDAEGYQSRSQAEGRSSEPPQPGQQQGKKHHRGKHGRR